MDTYLLTKQLVVNPRNIIKIGTIISVYLLEIKNQIKIFHWQTKGYAEHKTLDTLFDLLTKYNDRWVETFMGKYGRIQLTKHTKTLKLVNLSSDMCINMYLTQIVEILNNYRNKYFSDSSDSDLSNIFDEIIADINRAKYLLSLK
jgi:hypothetical protein